METAHNPTRGCIIVGYPGIGKSSIAALHPSIIIDLESSNFHSADPAFVSLKPENTWEFSYVLEAEKWCKEGFMVFISSHNKVIDFLLAERSFLQNFQIFLIYPSIYLESEWVTKLRTRCLTEKTEREKNKRAWERAETQYYDDIKHLEEVGKKFDDVIEIRRMDYNLEDIIKFLRAES